MRTQQEIERRVENLKFSIDKIRKLKMNTKRYLVKSSLLSLELGVLTWVLKEEK